MSHYVLMGTFALDSGICFEFLRFIVLLVAQVNTESI